MRNAGRIGFVNRGDYSETETYEFLHFVYYNGSTYVAKKTTIGNEPAHDNEYWHILASGGELQRTSDVSDTEIINPSEYGGRVNISDREKMRDFVGKVKKWFSDLKPVAFSGKYTDLEGRVTVTNNDAANIPGTAWDAVRGAQIRQDVNKLNSDLSRSAYNITAYCTFSYLGDTRWISSPIPILNANKYNIALNGNVKNTTEENTHVISGSYFTIHKYFDYFYLVTDNETVAGYLFGTVSPGIVWEISYNVAEL